MKFKQLAENIYISTQINEDDIAPMQQLGIKTVICHRFDNEENEQPGFEELAAKMRAAGIPNTHYQPIAAKAGVPEVNADTATTLERILNECEKPVLMFCKTGARSCAAWSILQAGKGISPEELIQKAAECERNIAALQPVLQEAFASSK